MTQVEKVRIQEMGSSVLGPQLRVQGSGFRIWQ
jgi:hypothetical protein